MMSSVPIARRAVRPEIQALRALAVGVVVLHHFWPVLAPAGYIGVDVFFVVSGYLITGMLVRELETTGRLSLSRFYGRRLRRILPSAVVVLAVTSVVTALAVPADEAARWFRQILASTLFVQNWLLAAETATDADAGLPSTPVEHYWSLSVEEQFYLVWPIVLLLATGLAARASRFGRTVPAVVIGLVTATSFVVCVVVTGLDNNAAYFSTVTRAWEFGVGALLALAPVMTGLLGVRRAVSWLGLAAIVASVYVATDVAAFPGVIALLPALGATAVIWAGTPSGRSSTVPLVRFPPVQHLGDISYALYLWHWPVVVLAPFITGRPSGNATMAALLAVAVVLAWATTRYVERPIRFGTTARTRPGTGWLVAATGALVLLLIGGATSAVIAAPDPPVRETCSAP